MSKAAADAGFEPATFEPSPARLTDRAGEPFALFGLDAFSAANARLAPLSRSLHAAGGLADGLRNLTEEQTGLTYGRALPHGRPRTGVAQRDADSAAAALPQGEAARTLP